MSLDPDDPMPSADALLAAACAPDRAPERLAFACRDLFAEDRDRIDDKVRVTVRQQLRGIVDGIAQELAGSAARALNTAQEPDAMAALAAIGSPYSLLVRHQLLADEELIGELLGRAELDAIGDRLPGAANDDPDVPSLLARLGDHADRLVAHAARALLAADSHRRDKASSGSAMHCALSAEVRHRLTWRVAAGIRTMIDGGAALDIALAEAVRRSLRAYDEGDRIEVAAMRMAAALDGSTDDLGQLLLDCLADRRLSLFVALLARALGTDFDAARELVLDRASDRLWVALRSLGLPRPVLAQVGFLLSEADPRRDLERFVERLDPAMAIAPDAASRALCLLRSDPVYRAALAQMRRAI